MALPKNRKAVEAILAEISPRIIGQKSDGFKCNCGAVHAGPATATAVVPAGGTYPGQEVFWYLWTVQMSYHPEDPKSIGGWSWGISNYIPREELEEMFARHFGPDPEDVNLYQLEVSGADRFYHKLPVAVSIQETESQIRFSFDWGIEQDFAVYLNAVEKLSPGRIQNSHFHFNELVKQLGTLNPKVYLGGPDPELPFEPKWWTDYASALKYAAGIANHIFFQIGGTSTDRRGTVQTNGDVVFMKLPVN